MYIYVYVYIHIYAYRAPMARRAATSVARNCGHPSGSNRSRACFSPTQRNTRSSISLGLCSIRYIRVTHTHTCTTYTHTHTHTHNHIHTHIDQFGPVFYQAPSKDSFYGMVRSLNSSKENCAKIKRTLMPSLSYKQVYLTQRIRGVYYIPMAFRPFPYDAQVRQP